ncbi:MAG TPA: DUF2780 domain-containing protein, partial [Steroidobacteraceae bacterium]|nr:DUF2780 domain-containing protein [Steroidobacteraceae bacterium]
AAKLQFPSPVTSLMHELVSQLINRVGVSEHQARAGTGALLKAAEERMDPAEFEQLLGSVPGVRDLLQAAPQKSATGGLLSGIASMIGGEQSDVAQATRLLTAFGSLNMGKDEIMKFLPIVTEYLKTHGGENIVDDLRAALRI